MRLVLGALIAGTVAALIGPEPMAEVQVAHERVMEAYAKLQVAEVSFSELPESKALEGRHAAVYRKAYRSRQDTKRVIEALDFSDGYDSSKAAANHLVRELAIELAPLVRVNGLAPATVVKGSSMFPRERIRIFELDGLESLQEWLP